MPLQQQIDDLRRRFQSGDSSARDALQRLVYQSLIQIVRRAAQPENAGSRVAGGIRRLSGQPAAAGTGGNGPPSAFVDELCRRLCDELLQAQVMGEQVQKVFETMRSVGRSTVLFGLRS
jgi:hypothetical protein